MAESNLIYLRPLNINLSTHAAAEEFSDAMMATVFAWRDDLARQVEAKGPPTWRAATVSVRLSEPLRAALLAAGAFELVVEAKDA